ncbi:unnamed protein product [Zymoseptoria tritici ST99CH_3D7]|uniref:DNA helicase n=1 Tax=Zymoseptoria tritici (strain ST99CH_3D7) TaxID=1276538 RepID=A0A1X7RU77_ZYMT9|nr:unnamed protein product [Zymoseptoria tritici ST99CH_3D7]
MAHHDDPISSDSTPNKRRKLNTESSGKAWDSENDSGEDLFNEHDFETLATTAAAPQAQRKSLQYGPSQLHADLGSASTRPPTQSGTFVTQPTQPLRHTTQPTQPLPPRSPEVLVERSSPPAPASTQKPAPAPINRAPFARPNGILARTMAPPGTTFRRPPGIQAKPAVIDLDDSDEDPSVQRSDEEEAPAAPAPPAPMRSNIKPTNFKRAGRGLDSSPNRAARELPQAAQVPAPTAFMGMLNQFGYQPTAPTQHHGGDSASAYANTSRPNRPLMSLNKQAGPSRANPVPRSALYQTIDDVDDYSLRNKVIEMQQISPLHTIQQCMDALTIKRGNVGDALAWLVEQDEAETNPDELSLSPIQKKGVAKTVSQNARSQDSSSQPVRATTKQQVKGAGMTIAEKYNAKKGNNPIKDALEMELDSDDEEVIRPRGRLMQGTRPVAGRPLSSSPPPVQPRPRNRLAKKSVVTIDSDSEGEDQDGSEDDFEELSGPPQRAEPEDNTGRMQEMRDDRLLKLFNECTVHDLAELSGHAVDNITFVLDQRPFIDLDHVRGIVMETLTKTGKKSKRVRQVGEKLVDDCIEVMTGYDAVDELVVKCEEIAKPLQEALKAWGVDKVDGELQIMKLDEAHDSGIGTPTSSCAADEAPTQKSTGKPKGKFLGQPENMNSKMVMKDYQLVGLNWLNLLYDRKLSCILADDMGLGKTCQIIGFLSHLQMKKVDGVHLIIVPGSTLENWLREFERFAPNLSVRPYYGLQKEREELRYQLEADFAEIDVVVTTYDMATGDADNHFLRHFGPYSVCVYDEAHMLRNPKSKRYRQLMRIGADFKVLLTGTPLQNNLQELVAILAFIMPDLFLEKSEDLEYIFKHKASTKDTAHAALLSGERIARARTMMTPFILRRKKHQVLDLPKKTSRVEWCDMSDTQANLYADVISEAQDFFNEKAKGTVKASASRSSNVIMSLRKAAIHPLLSRRIYDDKKIDKIVSALSKSDEFGANTPEKIRAYIDGSASDQVVKGGDFAIHRFCYDRDYLRKKFALKRKEWMDSGKVEVFKELIARWAANGDRVLVFSQFTTAMDILEAVLDTLDVKFMRLDGQTKMDIRQDMIDTFTNDTSIPVFMLSTKAGGAGINLAAANKVIVFDSGFNPQDDIQAENRAHRVGQTRDVEVVRLVTRGTIEEQIHALGESKLALDDRVAGEAASAAESSSLEKEGEKLVEDMLVKQIKGEDKKGGEETVKEEKEEKPVVENGGDLKDAFKKGLEGEGLKVESKQAQY